VNLKSIAGGRLPYRGLTRGTLAIGVLAFALPFAGVSCGGHHVFTASGLNAVAGGQYSVGSQVQHYSGDLSFLLAVLGGLVALACQFVLGPRTRVVASGAASLWSFVMLLVGQAHANAELSDLPGQVVVTVQWEAGFWLALVAMGISTVLAALELYSSRASWTLAGPADSPGLPGFPTLLPGGTASRSPAVTVSGVVAAVAGLMIIAAGQLPYIHYTDQATQPSTVSIFNPGFAASTWFAAEPVGVALLSIATGIVLMTSMSRILRAIAAAVLLASGAQTFLLFLGYVELAVSSQSAQVGPGGVVGMAAGALLFAAGLAPMRTLFTAASVSETPAAGTTA
jgi:hypothetical protein